MAKTISIVVFYENNQRFTMRIPVFTHWKRMEMYIGEYFPYWEKWEVLY